MNLKTNNPGKLFSHLLLFLLIILLILGCSIFTLSSYEEIKEAVIPEKIYTTIGGYSLGGANFNESRYILLKNTVLVFTAFALILIIYLFRKSSDIIYYSIRFGKFVANKINDTLCSFSRLALYQKIISLSCLITIALFKVYLVLTLEPNPDETRTYDFFIGQGFWIILTYYPDTNNHILYNLVCLAFDPLFDNPLWVVRTPSLISTLLLTILLFFYTQHRLGYKTALIAVGLSSFIAVSGYFGAIGRGHLFMCLLGFLSIISVINISDGGHRRSKLLIFTLTSALALYAVPTYIFFLGSIIAYMMIDVLIKKDILLFKDITKASIFTGILTVLFYAPVMLVNGTEVLLDNRWTQPYEYPVLFQLYPAFIMELTEYYIGILSLIRKGYLLGMLLIIAFLYLLRRPDLETVKKRWIVLLGVCYVVPLAMVLFIKILPPYRVFTYAIFLLHINIGILISYVMDQWIRNSLMQHLVVLILFLAALLWGVYTYDHHLY